MAHDKYKEQINNWYHEYSNDLYQYIVYLIRDTDQAKDLLQDTFLQAYKNMHTFKQKNPKGWLFKISRNLTIDYIRKKHPIYYLMDTIPNMEKTPDHILHMNESNKELYTALDQLKRSYRDVILLRKIKDFSVIETAEILGWNESKVRTTLSRAMKALRNQLEKEGYQHETF
ncbi:RNA polymerase sigma factor [Bacillaceae bacterium W0354]